MDRPLCNIDDIIVKSAYFQELQENLLRKLVVVFHCFKFATKILLHGPDKSGKRLMAKTASKTLSLNFCEEQVFDLFDDNIIGTEKKIKAAIAKHKTSAPCLIYWSGYELFQHLEDRDLDCIERCIRASFDELVSDKNSQPVVFIAATNDFDQIYRSPLYNMFHENIRMKPLSSSQFEKILNEITNETNLELQQIEFLDKRGVESYIGNLYNFIAGIEVTHYRNKIFEPNCDNIVTEDKEGTRWADIGGLNDVKKDIIDTIQLPLIIPQLKKSGRRTGILLCGPPGTGKTLLAKAVARECSLTFIGVKGPELLSEYVGESEGNVRKLFQKARESSPAVIFFDELDSLAPVRGQAGDSGGVADRVVSQILCEMDGVGKTDDVFVIGATNRVDMVDPALLRPGRFDKVLEVQLPASKEHRLEILEALTRKLRLADDVDLGEIESLTPSNMSGADFQGLCSRALQKTILRCVEKIESGEATEDDAEIIISKEDFLQSIYGNDE